MPAYRSRVRSPMTGWKAGQWRAADPNGHHGAASLAADVIRADGAAGFRAALREAIASPRTTVVHLETGPLGPAPAGGAWWTSRSPRVSALEHTRTRHDDGEKARRRYL